MTQQVSSIVCGDEVDSHPAVQAWSQVASTRQLPTGIQTLKAAKSKSSVYRLEGLREDGGAVIAKRCRAQVAGVERSVYESVLPRLPVPTLKYYGFLPEQAGVYAWLFVEDAGDIAYDPLLQEHRCLAARWLATLHLAARDLVDKVDLPSRGPESYLEQTTAVRQAIYDSRPNPLLSGEDRQVLEQIDQVLAQIEASREAVQAVCAGIPRTLVHGDFVGKNIRLRPRNDGANPEFFALDWETSGWGVPAIDLCRFVGVPAMPDLQTYCSVLRAGGDDLDSARVEELAALGGVFRMVSAMFWASMRLSQPWIGKCMVWMRSYHESMLPALSATSWGRHFVK
jgi:hypothetical protein